MSPFDIIAALRNIGHTQTSVAELLEVPVDTVNGVIHARTRSFRTASFIATTIGRSVDELWPGSYAYKPRPRSMRYTPRVKARFPKTRVASMKA